MALSWNIVTAEHVRQACELVATGESAPRTKAKGIFVVHRGKRLPAKHVLRTAYLLAKGSPLDTELRFSSGESTVQRLRRLGFEVIREDGAATSSKVGD